MMTRFPCFRITSQHAFVCTNLESQSIRFSYARSKLVVSPFKTGRRSMPRPSFFIIHVFSIKFCKQYV